MKVDLSKWSGAGFELWRTGMTPALLASGAIDADSSAMLAEVIGDDRRVEPGNSYELRLSNDTQTRVIGVPALAVHRVGAGGVVEQVPSANVADILRMQMEHNDKLVHLLIKSQAATLNAMGSQMQRLMDLNQELDEQNRALKSEGEKSESDERMQRLMSLAEAYMKGGAA